MKKVTHWEDILISPSTAIIEAVKLLDKSAMQVLMVVDEQRRLLGTVTDGDIRRGILRSLDLSEPVDHVMTSTPLTASPDSSKEDLLKIMSGSNVHQIPLVNSDNQVVGLKIIDNLVNPETTRKNWVVLMAGGLGSRLMPLTEETPKPMLNVGGKPVLETILENFIKHGFRRFYISVNYKADAIIDHFGDGERWNAEIRYLRETVPLGTAGPLSLITELPKEPVVVMNGDLVTQINFRELLDHHLHQGSKATMCVREYDFQVPFGVVSIEDNQIKGIDEKPVHRFFVNAGIYVLDPKLIELAPKDKPFHMTDLFDSAIKGGHMTAVFPIHEYWLDIGRADDLDRAKMEFETVFRK